MLRVVDFLSGALTFANLVAAVYFLQFWRRTRDGLFLMFAIGFVCFALNRGLVSYFGDADERVGHAYAVRVLGFLLILVAIVRKNLQPSRNGRG